MARLLRLAWGCAVVGATAAAQTLFEDDFESFQLLPPGLWEATVEQGGTVAIAPGAAHRGDAGVRATDTDGTGASNVTAELGTSFPTTTSGSVYYRYWVRVSGSNTAGARFNIGSVGGRLIDGGQLSMSGGATLTDFRFEPDTTRLWGGGYDGTQSYSDDPSDGGLTLGAWHLLEAGMTGIGSDAGYRRVWVDRQAISEGPHAYGNVWAWRINVGETWSTTGTFTGQIDVDDVRASRNPPASGIGLAVDAGDVPQGSCVPVEVVLLDSAGQLAGAPYTMAAVLDADAGGTYFVDSACTQPTNSVSLDAGQARASAAFRPTSIGSLALTAAHPDLISLPAAPLSVSAAGTSSDAGVLELVVGCGCTSVRGPWIALAAVGLALVSRRRIQPGLMHPHRP